MDLAEFEKKYATGDRDFSGVQLSKLDLEGYRKNAVKPCPLGQGCKAHTVLSSQTCDKIAV
jgi:hypothetical protein